MTTEADDTIFALSSGALPAAIAVVRISGSGAAEALRTLAGTLPPPRRAVSARLRFDGEILDRSLILWLPGPTTATGEDMAELHLHGSRAVAAAVLTALGAIAGLRPAEAGEFTRRAFLHGRLDLAQAEGLADLLTAETEAQRRQAVRQLEGGLGRLIEGWRVELLATSARVEAAIEFGEEEPDVPPLSSDDQERLLNLANAMKEALAQPPAERLRDGVRIVLGGPVNAGKSSLFNMLAGREAAIASPEAGTTRDLIEVPVVIAGMPCLLIDSAGLRCEAGHVEQLGIGRARQALDGADLILWLGPAAECPDRSRSLLVHAQADLGPAMEQVDIATSIVSGEGIGELRRLLEARVAALLPQADAVSLNVRQRQCVMVAEADVQSAARLPNALLVAEHLRGARVSLDRITGRAGVEEMLDGLFGQFCIGK